MEIVPIYPPYVYSVQYDDREDAEFDRLFTLWNDMEYVCGFMEQNKEYLANPVWGKTPEPEDAARQVLNEAEELEELFDELNNNTVHGNKPDFDSHFKYLDGDYKFEFKQPPMKSYGTERPSLLRIYAIKLQPNTYIITGGGIKLADKIQNSPDLKEHVLKNIGKVIRYLKENGVFDSNDLED